VIVDCALYRNGRRVPAPAAAPDVLAQARADADAFCWIGLFEPSREEFDAVTGGLGLHPLAAEDAVTAHQRPKLEVYDAALFLVLKPVRYDDSTDTITVSEINIFVGDSFVVTVRHGRANPLGEVRARLEGQPDVLAHGPTAVVYAVCDAIVDNYLDVADDFHTDLEELEAEVFHPGGGTGSSPGRIYDFKRQALEFRRVTGPLTEPITRLTGAAAPAVRRCARQHLRLGLSSGRMPEDSALACRPFCFSAGCRPGVASEGRCAAHRTYISSTDVTSHQPGGRPD
jgi:magnesium transporter